MEDISENFRAFLETIFESERAKKSPEIYFGPKSFSTIFEKRTPVYSLAARLLGLAKSIYQVLPSQESPSFAAGVAHLDSVYSRHISLPVNIIIIFISISFLD